MDAARRAAGDEADEALAARFGALAVTLAREGPVPTAWKLSFLANVFTGPLYRLTEARFGLSRPDFVILLCLGEEPGLMARDVGRLTGLPKNSISRAVGGLERRGLIERARDEGDRRGLRLHATPQGTRPRPEAALPLLEAREAAMTAALTPQERESFDALLAKLVAAVPRWVEPDRRSGPGDSST